MPKCFKTMEDEEKKILLEEKDHEIKENFEEAGKKHFDKLKRKYTDNKKWLG